MNFNDSYNLFLKIFFPEAKNPPKSITDTKDFEKEINSFIGFLDELINLINEAKNKESINTSTSSSNKEADYTITSKKEPISSLKDVFINSINNKNIPNQEKTEEDINTLKHFIYS